MSGASDLRIASWFGLLGAALLFVQGIVDLLLGVISLAVKHPGPAFGVFDQGVILVVVGIIVAFFAAVGRLRGEGRSVVAGVVLIVLALVGWIALGFGSGILALLGSVLIVVSGVVYLLAGR